MFVQGRKSLMHHVVVGSPPKRLISVNIGIQLHKQTTKKIELVKIGT